VPAPVDVDAMSDQELYAYRKRTAPVEDVRFLLRVCGHRMTDEERASFTELIEAGPKARSAFYAEYHRRKEAWRARERALAPRPPREADSAGAADVIWTIARRDDGYSCPVILRPDLPEVELYQRIQIAGLDLRVTQVLGEGESYRGIRARAWAPEPPAVDVGDDEEDEIDEMDDEAIEELED